MDQSGTDTQPAPWRDRYDYHHRPFAITGLIDILQRAQQRWPGCYVGRSGNGLGNINIYSAEGSKYLGVIEMNDRLELGLDLDEVAFDEPFDR